MESTVSFFLVDFIQFCTAAFLCFYTVLDSLRMPVWRIAVCTVSFITAFCLLEMMISTESLGFFGFATTPAAFLCGALFLFRAASPERGKLLFILLLVGSYLFFSDTIGSVLCLLFGIEIDSFNYKRIAVLVLNLAVTVYPFARFMDWLWSRIRGLRDVSWFRLCLVPLGFTLMFILAIVFWATGLITAAAFVAFDLLIIACALITYWQIVDGLSKAAEAARLTERLRSTDNQLLLQAGFLKEASAHEGEVRQLRHDLRHHFAALESMLTQREIDRARKYLREYIIRVEDAVTSSVCENTVADAVCKRFAVLAGQRDIQTDIAADIPERAGVADSDLAVLLSNLWENALEACERQRDGHRYIRLRAKFTGNSLMISITNSFDGVTRSRAGKESESVLLSLKRGGAEEGIGIASIRAITRRYRGLDEFTHDAVSFNVRVLLYVEGDVLSQ